MSTLVQDCATEAPVREGESSNCQVGTKAKRTLIIPDVHTRWRIAQDIIDSVPHDHVIHLGDHQDNFGDTVGHAVNTARWTRDRLDARDIVLLGNHDLPYWFWHEKHDWGCGWTPDKHRAIQSIIPWKERLKFRLWTDCEGWLLSHAGICSLYADLIPNQEIFLEETLWAKKTHPMIYHVGGLRGGFGNKGGCLWLDWHDLSPIAWKQIVGHTPHKKPQSKNRMDGNKDWNLDTHLHHYGIIEEGKLTIHEVSR